MKSTTKQYQDLAGHSIDLSELDARERSLIRELQEKARSLNDWSAFDNFRNARIRSFYRARGLTPAQTTRKATYRIAQDLSNRLAVKMGQARPTDYRDELEDIIRSGFNSQRQFCESTGLSEDMVSHVLARRKHIAIDKLNDALARVGYAVRIVPARH